MHLIIYVIKQTHIKLQSLMCIYSATSETASGHLWVSATHILFLLDTYKISQIS